MKAIRSSADPHGWEWPPWGSPPSWPAIGAEYTVEEELDSNGTAWH